MDMLYSLFGIVCAYGTMKKMWKKLGMVSRILWCNLIPRKKKHMIGGSSNANGGCLTKSTAVSLDDSTTQTSVDTRHGRDCLHAMELERRTKLEELGMDPENEGIISDLLRFVSDQQKYYKKAGKDWSDQQKYYKKAGKDWRRGYLLYGSPGTDRSSLIAAMANFLEFDIYHLDLTDVTSIAELTDVLVSIRNRNRSLISIQDFDHWAGKLPDFRTELTLSSLLKIIHGLLSSCGDEQIIALTTNHNHVERVDATLLCPLNNDLYIHMSSHQPKALPDGGEIVLVDSSEQKPLVDFYATNSRAYQSDILVANSTREASRRQCMPERVLSLFDSAARISSANFDASDNSAHLVRAYQSGPVVFNSEKKDTGEGLNTECLTKSVHVLDDSSKQKSLSDVAVTESKSHLVRPYQNGPFVSLSDNKNRGEALKRECNPKSILRSENLQQHSGGRRDDAAKSFCTVYDPGSHTKASLALISLEVLETLLIRKQPNDSVLLLPLGRLTHEDCVQREKSPDLPGVAQNNGVERRVNKLPRYLGGLTAQSASSSRWPIGLPDGGHNVLIDPLDQSAIHIDHAARADQCSPTLSLGEKKMVRKTLNRKCRTKSVLFEGNHRHFARGCEDAAKSLGVMHIFRKHGINQVSTMKRIKQHGIHQWPFRQKWATRKGDLQQHFGCKRKCAVKSLGVSRSMFKSTCRQHWVYWWPCRFENNDSLAWKSFKVLDSLPLGEQSNSIRNLVRQRALMHNQTHKHCVRLKKPQDQPQSMLRDCLGGLAAQSDISLPDGGHILSLSQKKIVRKTLKRKCRTMSVLSVDAHQQYVGRRWEDAVKFSGVKRICKQLAIQRETTAKRIRRQLGTRRWLFKQSAIRLPGHILYLSEKKIVRKTLKRKCRSTSVISLDDHKQHVDRRWEDAAKSHGTKRICRKLSTAKCIRKQHGIHQWPFQQSTIGLPDGGHIQPLSEKKIVRKTLKRKCRSMSVLSLVVRRQHVDRRSEDAAKNIGVKHNCGQLVIHHVSRAKHICRQHGIYHRWPFEQDWATMKGYSLGNERPVEVICISTHVNLGSSLQLIYISWLGRFSPRPSALAGGGEIGGPIVSSCSESAASSNIAQRFGQYQSGSAASDSENERTREQGDPEGRYTNIAIDDLRRLYGRMNRGDAAASLGVSVATFKRKCREFGLKRWPRVRKGIVWRPPDRNGKGNTSTVPEMPSHNVRMEGGLNQEAIALNTESGSIMVPRSPACQVLSYNVEVEPVGQYQEADMLKQDFTGGPIDLNTDVAFTESSGAAAASQFNLDIWENGEDFWAADFNLTAPSCFDLGPSQPMPAISHTMPTIPQMMPLLRERQDKMSVKAVYGDVTIKFDLPLTSGIKELKEEVSETLKTLEGQLGRFRVLYEDGEGDWILMARDENVREYLQLVTLLGSKEAKLKVDRVPIATTFCGNCECGNCRSLKQTRP